MNTKLTEKKILEKITTPKICSYCKELKQYEELVRRSKYKGTDIYSTASYCKKCHNKKREKQRKNNPITEARKESNKRRYITYREVNKDKIKEKYCSTKAKNTRLKSKYGVDLDWFYAKLIEINFTCCICLEPIDEKTGVIDHCHETNIVRHVICNKCNTAIGFFKEKEDNMLRAIEYLKKYGHK